MTQREIIQNNFNKSDWEITKDKCDSTRAHRRHLAANGKHENKRKIYCTNVHLRIIEILITLMYHLSAVTAAASIFLLAPVFEVCPFDLVEGDEFLPNLLLKKGTNFYSGVRVGDGVHVRLLRSSSILVGRKRVKNVFRGYEFRKGSKEPLEVLLTRSRGRPGHGTLRWTRTSKQAGKALRSQGHHYARVM